MLFWNSIFSTTNPFKKKMKRKTSSLLEEEKLFLQPLPPRPFELCSVENRDGAV